MMDDQAGRTRAIPAWFWAGAGLALLFELFGCMMYLSDVTANHAALPLDQRAMWAATPTWLIGLYALAVWSGLAGAVALLLRQRIAVPVLLFSLLAALVQFAGLFLIPQLRQTLPDSALVAPIAICLCCYGIFLLARLAGRRGWLR
jgi:hypothetical protein